MRRWAGSKAWTAASGSGPTRTRSPSCRSVAAGGEGRGVASSLLHPPRPKPFRGDVIPAGVVVLTTLVWVVATRFDAAWGDGAHLTYGLVAWAFVTTLAVLAPMEGDAPRAYQSVLYVAAVALLPVVLDALANLLGAHRATGSAGAITWVLRALAGFALGVAARPHNAPCPPIRAPARGGAGVPAGGGGWWP